jgi:hypothetical protein
LERLDSLTNPGSLEREALRKAGFALGLSFLRGDRQKLERLYENPPLNEEEREKLRSYGYDPDAECGSP